MWWNFIGRSYEEVVAFREEWQRQRAGRTPGVPGRYGAFPDVWEHTLAAPELPNVRLRSRGSGDAACPEPARHRRRVLQISCPGPVHAEMSGASGPV